MQTIEIQYRPLLLPWKRTISGSFPDKVEELNGRQMEAVAAMVRGNIDDDTFLAAMTSISKKIVRRLAPFYKFRLMQLFTVFNKATPHNKFIITRIHAGSVQLVSPAPKLKGFSFGQFIFADTLFDVYAENKTTANLSRFVAALYMPAGQKFSEELIEKHCSNIEKVNADTLEAIVINYGLVREWLGEVYPLVFVKSSQPPEANSPKPVSGNAWIKVFESLVGDDIVHHENYAALPVHNVFRYMSEKIKQNMKRKR